MNVRVPEEIYARSKSFPVYHLKKSYKEQWWTIKERPAHRYPSWNQFKALVEIMSLVAILLMCFTISRTFAAPTQVQLSNLNPYPDKPRITFRPDGSFKITVFSDLHFGENAWDAWGPQQDVNSTILMNAVLSSDRPDYVVFNGDQITGENTFRQNSTLYIDEVLAPVMKADLPFSSIGGNHDNQVNITHLQEIEREKLIASRRSYTRSSPPGVGGDPEQGPSNYWVPVYAKPTDLAPALVLWFFDSRSGFSAGANSTAVPDWVDQSVASWIESETNTMNEVWGPSENRGALVFVHIPPHDLQAMQATLNSTENPGINDDLLGSGSTQATNNPADAGNDEPVWNAINTNIKNIHAVTFGHDHGDAWCARDPSQDVICCFAKHSGYGGYDYGWGHGARNFQFYSPNPQVGVETWIRMEDGEINSKITLDSNYKK